MTTTADQFLLGGGGKSAKFDAIGASITGTIASAPEVKQQTSMETGQPLTWDNGDPRMQLVVTLQTSLREDEDDDGLRKLYVKGSKDPASQSLHAAVAGAVHAAGAKGLDVGGTLTVTYVADGVAKTRGYNPPKKYTATYKAPDAAAFLGTEQGQVNTATGEITTPPPAAAPGQPTPEQIAALRSAGIDPATVYPNFTG
jgi:hypothetical protein